MTTSTWYGPTVTKFLDFSRETEVLDCWIRSTTNQTTQKIVLNHCMDQYHTSLQTSLCLREYIVGLQIHESLMVADFWPRIHTICHLCKGRKSLSTVGLSSNFHSKRRDIIKGVQTLELEILCVVKGIKKLVLITLIYH